MRCGPQGSLSFLVVGGNNNTSSTNTDNNGPGYMNNWNGSSNTNYGARLEVTCMNSPLTLTGPCPLAEHKNTMPA